MADRMCEGDERIAKARAGSIVRHGARARLIASVGIGITRRSHGARSVPFVSRAIGLILPVTPHVCTHEAIRRVDRAAEHQVRLVPSWTLLRDLDGPIFADRSAIGRVFAQHAVQPARYTRRLAISMKNSTYN